MKNVPKEYAEIYERLATDYEYLLKLILSENDDISANEFLRKALVPFYPLLCFLSDVTEIDKYEILKSLELLFSECDKRKEAGEL